MPGESYRRRLRFLSLRPVLFVWRLSNAGNSFFSCLLTFCQERECSTHWRKIRQQCGGAHQLGTFSSVIRVRSTGPPSVSESSPKQSDSDCSRIKVVVESVVGLVCACWLMYCGMSLRPRRHLTLNILKPVVISREKYRHLTRSLLCIHLHYMLEHKMQKLKSCVFFLPACRRFYLETRSIKSRFIIVPLKKRVGSQVLSWFFSSENLLAGAVKRLKFANCRLT